jgi:serine protease AprX
MFALMMMIGLLGPASIPMQASAAGLPPALAQIVSESPEEMVRVIVQKADDRGRTETLVSQLGGMVIKDLGLIHAFAAQLPAKALPRLAAVTRVSLDAPVKTTGMLTQTETLFDSFNVKLYSNNNGTQPWSSDWIEINDDSRPDGGKIKIDKDQLKLEDKNRGIQRSADLSMAENATLSFYYRRDKLDKPSKYVNLEISTDGGATWTELYRFGDGKDGNLMPISFDLSPYLSANTTLRFFTSPDDAGKLYVDNFKIEYSYSYDDGRDCGSEAYTVRDEFSSGGYTGNDGSIAWASNWMEVDDRTDSNQDPAAGLVQIDNGELRLNNLNYGDPNPGIQRAVDLTGGISCARLSFDFRTSYRVSVADTIAIEISSDGGDNFIILDTIDYISGAVSDYKTYDISPFATSNTVIRIRVGKFYGLDDHYFYLDNLQISYTFGPEVPHCNNQTVGDDFQAYPYTYDNNIGSRNWLTPWQEIGENDGPNAGDIHFSTSAEFGRFLYMWETYTDGVWDPEAGVWRTADLSGASEAKLSFLYRRSTMMADDYLAVEASPDGGATWNEVGRITGEGTSNVSVSDYGWRFAEFDISPYITTNTGVRLVTQFVHDDYFDTIYIDDVQINFNDLCSAMPPNTYLDTLRVPQVWDLGLDGSGVTVAVIDSGIALDDDFSDVAGEYSSDRVIMQLGFNSSAYTVQDVFGHGTHVAGIIGGNGTKSDGVYQGVAPGVNLIGIKISDDYGMAYESDTVEALQWVFDHKDEYNIRVVNLSIQSTVEQSYHDSALDAAAEILWFNGIVVVAATGNKGPDNGFNPVLAAPANDPFIITVGASEEKGDADRANDSIASFTAYDETIDYFVKPEIIAPGKDIVSVLAGSSWWRNDHPDRFVEGGYFRISGTSMSTPMVAGAAALLLQSEPDLTPDQVKYRLLETAGKVGKANYLDVYAAVTTPTIESANQGIVPHMLLAKMAMIAYWANENGGEDIDWDAVNWDAVNWNAVNWNAVNWNAVNWNAVNWNAVNWNAVNWNAVNWNAVNWNAVNWNAVNWNAVNWNAVNWNAVNWNAVNWEEE